MPEEVIAFLNSNRVCVLGLSTPHAATVHYAFRTDPLSFVFLTDRSTRKAAALQGGAVPAALVIGTDEEQMKTLQLTGIARLAESESDKETYLARFPERRAWAGTPDAAFIAFAPSWWRYSDLKAPGGEVVIES